MKAKIVLFSFFLFTFAFANAAFPQSKRPGQAEWDRSLKAAREEGSVVVLGPPGNDVRRALTEPFEKAFPGIRVEYTGATGSKMAPRLLSERRARQYLADVHVGNPGTATTTLLPAGVLDNIRPLLTLPEVVDLSKWWQGRFDFADREGKYNLVFSTNVMTHVAVNPQSVKKGELRSYSDLLNPKWKGKVAMYDPMILGPGSGTLSFFYAHTDLGKDFLRKLFTQQGVILSRDNRQLLEWLARGNYSIAIAPSELHVTELKSKGLPIELVHAEQFKEGGLLNAGFGAVSLIDRPPHPNAAAVYINWLLSKDGQTEWVKASGYPSRRLDVPRSQFDPGVLPREGVPYLPGYGEQYNRVAAEANEFAKSLIKQ